MAPKDEPQGMQSEAALLEAFGSLPTISGAWLRASGNQQDIPLTLTVQSVQRNVSANAQRKFLTTFSLPREYGGQPLQPTFPVELKDVLLLSVSPSGSRTLVVRGGGDKASALLEVWGGGRLLRELSVPTTLHGAVYNDGWFAAGAAWSPDEQRVAYVAEAPADVQTPLWGNSASANEDKISGGDADGNRSGAVGDDGQEIGADGSDKKGKADEGAQPKTWRGVGTFQEDWGELNTGKRRPALFVLDTTSWHVVGVQGLPPGATAGQPVWTPSGDALVCVVWPHTAPNFPALPQRLGIVYCFNRPCALYAVAAPGTSAERAGDSDEVCEAVRLTKHSQLQSAFAPRFVPGGDQLVFLSQHAACVSGVHNGTTSVHSLPWRQNGAAGAAEAEAREVLAVVASPQGDGFPGLYTVGLLPQPIVGGRLVTHTQWRDVGAIVAVDVDGASPPGRLTPQDGNSWSLLDCQAGWLVAVCSSPSSPPALHLARLPEGTLEGPLQWTAVTASDSIDFDPAVCAALADIQVDTLQLRPEEGTPGGAVPFEAVVIRPASAQGPCPGIVLPHGGPHSAYVRSYMLPTAFLPALGYAIIAPNFRGSTGYGEDCIQALPGHAGSADVADCMAALHAAVDRGWVDPERVAIVGGSHGGFLAGHLAGQHPGSFRAAVLRNPVLDLSVMIHLSDIPDWCYIEAWGCQEGQKRMAARPSAEDLERFRAVSPIAHAHAVKAAMLFMLGAKDRRVPLTDAQLYVRALAARGDAPEARTIVFPEDTHALDRPQTEFEQWINVAAWLKTHLAKN
eukprot:CAMPEP_0206148488 /NCGR_PEP_ID=MMETSP1473-20131121/36760_1 /ASSEMBLY_ACC=CAM_ASM_001109 /TAXON_ID=1461547 /ORGANISM="Stichococcus sp, Strain RCC1054" /LENGTH=792 /DNA_ID=CAMNT_0053545837 /DNA_START=314 /DNA_END=2692 /DNA_ORIENTATION=-